MPLTITKISEVFSTCPQITVNDIPEISVLGFKTIINNRPDGEGGAVQPTSATIQAAAEKAGLAYIHLPIIPGNITESQVAECATFLAGAASPILGFCRTGNRASNIYQQALNKNSSPPKTSAASQNWLMAPICNFFKNKCLITRLVRKLNSK